MLTLDDWQRLAETSPDGLFVASLDNQYLYINPALERLTGISADELHADFTAYQKVFHPEDRERHRREIVSRGDGPRGEERYMYRICVGDAWRLILVRLWLMGPEGPRVGWISDVTAHVCGSMAIQLDLATGLPELDALTPREREIVKHLFANRSHAEIATQLAISEATVRNHMRAVYTKLDLGSQRELILRLSGCRWKGVV